MDEWVNLAHQVAMLSIGSYDGEVRKRGRTDHAVTTAVLAELVCTSGFAW